MTPPSVSREQWDAYRNGDPFPHIVSDGLLPPDVLVHGASGLADAWPAQVPIGDAIEVPARTVLFRQGQDVRALYLMETGVVALTKQRGDREVLVALRSAGWLVGLSSAILELRHATTAETLSSCRLRQMSLRAFRDAANDGLGPWLHRTLARESAEQLARFTRHVGRSSVERVEALLDDLFRIAGEPRPDGGCRLALVLTVERIADAALITREQASRVIARFVKAGFLRRDSGGWFLAPKGSPFTAGVGPKRKRRET